MYFYVRFFALCAMHEKCGSARALLLNLFFLCQLLSNSNALPAAPSFEPSASVLRTQSLRMHQLEALRGGVGSGDFRGDQSPRGDSLVKFHSDVARLTELRKTEMSQVQYISTTGSTYTVLWTKEAWDDHIHISRYWRHFTTWHLSTTAMVIWPPVIFFGVWAAGLCLAKKYLKVDLSVPLAPLTLVTTALALLLTTKTNQSLIRLLEARLAWGKLVLHARVIAGILHTRLYPVNAAAALLGGRLLCTIGWSLRASLVGRGDKAIDKEALQALLPIVEADWLAKQYKPSLAAIDCLGHLIRGVATDNAYSGRNLAAEPHRIILEQLVELDGCVGICERIMSSPVPPTYTRFTSRMLLAWLACVPSALQSSGMSSIAVIFGTVFIAYVMIGIDEIAVEIEEPFRLLPLNQISNVLMRDVLSRMAPQSLIPTVRRSASGTLNLWDLPPNNVPIRQTNSSILCDVNKIAE